MLEPGKSSGKDIKRSGRQITTTFAWSLRSHLVVYLPAFLSRLIVRFILTARSGFMVFSLGALYLGLFRSSFVFSGLGPSLVYIRSPAAWLSISGGSSFSSLIVSQLLFASLPPSGYLGIACLFKIKGALNAVAAFAEPCIVSSVRRSVAFRGLFFISLLLSSSLTINHRFASPGKRYA